MFGWLRNYFRTAKLTLVTAADTSHAQSLLNLLASIQQHERETRVVVYDLGMTDPELIELKSRFGYEVRTFDFAKYPAFFDIRIAAGEYAWKAQIVRDVALETSGLLCWMDAGNVIIEPLLRLRRETLRNGYYCPQSAGTISDWTHPGTLSYFCLPATWKSKLPNLNTACVAFNMQSPMGTKLVQEWAEYAAIRECIAPAGSSRANHRQDQALFTVIAYRAGRPDRAPKAARRLLGFRLHQDAEDQSGRP